MRRVEQDPSPALVERAQGIERRDPCAMEDVVGETASDARARPLVAQHRVHTTLVVAVQNDLGELLRGRLRAEPIQPPAIAVFEDPPRGLAFGAELLDEHRGSTFEPQTEQGTFRFRGLRWLFEDDAA